MPNISKLSNVIKICIFCNEKKSLSVQSNPCDAFFLQEKHFGAIYNPGLIADRNRRKKRNRFLFARKHYTAICYWRKRNKYILFNRRGTYYNCFGSVRQTALFKALIYKPIFCLAKKNAIFKAHEQLYFLFVKISYSHQES